jgi:calcineurin-like phosphoesterase family protein
MIYLTSDLHWWHVNILKYTKRPWGSLEEMHEGLIKLYNNIVKEEDEVYFLGDIMMGSRKEMPDRMQKIFSRLPGRKYLLRGNHDYRHSDEQWFYKHFVWVKDIYELKLEGYPMMVLHHFPHYSWHGMGGKNSVDVHGHCHGNIDKANLNTRRIDVGVDAMYSNFAPISVQQIDRIMGNRKPEIVDHHGEQRSEM